MIYGEPTEQHLEVMSRPVSVFSIDEIPSSSVYLHEDFLQDPVSMRAQAQGTLYLASMSEPRDIDIEADGDILKAFTNLAMHTTGCSSNQAYDLLDQVTREASTVILKEKYRHNYPRPHQVVTEYLADFKPSIDSQSAATPSYPSGHSAQAYLLALIFSEAYPHRASAFHNIADTIGIGRVLIGLHTKEDHDYGQDIGAYLFHALSPAILSILVDLMR